MCNFGAIVYLQSCSAKTLAQTMTGSTCKKQIEVTMQNLQQRMMVEDKCKQIISAQRFPNTTHHSIMIYQDRVDYTHHHLQATPLLVLASLSHKSASYHKKDFLERFIPSHIVNIFALLRSPTLARPKERLSLTPPWHYLMQPHFRRAQIIQGAIISNSLCST